MLTDQWIFSNQFNPIPNQKIQKIGEKNSSVISSNFSFYGGNIWGGI
jgi:hypothetical protein